MDIEITPSFKKRLSRKTKSKVNAILRCIDRLAENPHHPGLRTSRLGGTEGIFEARASAGDRVTFQYGTDRIVMLNHCNHDIVR